MVTMADIQDAIRWALMVPGGFGPLPVLPPTDPLEAKLQEEGCSANTIERSTSLRVVYREYWSDRRGW